MDHELLFSVINTSILPFWVILFFAPKWKYRNPIVYLGVLAFALFYTIIVATSLPLDISSFGSLYGVMELFTDERAVLIGWAHYLAFDLFVGNWIVNQANEYHIKHHWIIPCLLFAFMFGPAGYLLFMLLKLAKVGRIA